MSRFDLPRLLHVRSQFGYTHLTLHALASEPEAVPPDYQQELTRRAARAAQDREAELLRTAAARIGLELDVLLEECKTRRVQSHVRAMQRQLSQLARLAD